jgi:O-Antigen ligase
LLPTLLLATLVLVALLPFGSAYGLAVSAVEVMSLGAAALLFAFEGLERARRALRVLLLPLGLLLGVLFLQVVPLPLGWLHWMSPTTASLYRQMIDSSARWFTISIDPHGSLLAILRLGACAAVFLVAAAAPVPGRGSLLYWSVLLSGTLGGAVAWWHAYQGWGTLLFGQFVRDHAIDATGRLHWPLLNANHLATWMNVTWILALGAILWPPLLGARSSRLGGSHRALAAVALVVSLSALVGTRSRGGAASAAAGFGILVLLWPPSGRTARQLLTGLRALAGVAVVCGAAWIGWEALHPPGREVVLAALASHDATLQVRFEMIRQSLPMIGDFAALGTGLGTFAEAFPRYWRYPLLFATVPHLHCEPLEWLSDLGVVGATLVLLLAARYARRVAGGGDSEWLRRRAILAAAIGSVFVHALGDFALRIPAIAIGTAVLLGLLWRERTRGEAELADSAATAALGPLDRAVAVVAAGLVLYACSWEWRDATTLAAVTSMQWVETPPSAAWRVYERLAWQRQDEARSGVDPGLRAVAAAPTSSASHRALAYAYRSVEMRERELRRAVACEPANRYGRIAHALVLAGLGQLGSALQQVEQGFYLDPEFGEQRLLELEDPTDESRPFLEAALRGMRRRVLVSPEVAGELRRFEELQQVLRLESERRRRGR